MFARLFSRKDNPVTLASTRRTPPVVEACEPRQLLAVDVLTYHNNLERTGANLNETILTTSNVRSSSFGKKFSFAVDGQVYAQPLYASRLSFQKAGRTVRRNMVYVATQHDSVYAFDADRGSRIWSVRALGTAFGETSVPAEDTGIDDVTPEVGITSTPVIDKATNTLYVVSKAKRGSGPPDESSYVFRLYALDLITGAKKFGGPVILRASVPGTGEGSSNGIVQFLARYEHQRPGLALHDGIIYIAFASHGDVGPYHGWVLGYDASNLQQVKVWNTTPDGEKGGIWQSGGAPAIDADGNMFIGVGNGTADVQTGGSGYGSSFVRVPTSGTFAPTDFFIPSDFDRLNVDDLDLGSSGVVILPDRTGAHPHQLVFGGKEGKFYLADRDNLGGFNAGGDQILQSLGPTDRGGVFSNPAYFNNRIFIASIGDPLESYRIGTDRLVFSQTTGTDYRYPGATPSISANGADNGIVWVIRRSADDRAVLEAFSATNLTKRLYTSDQAGDRDHAGPYVKFTVPTIADGKVFMGTDGELAVYGLLT